VRLGNRADGSNPNDRLVRADYEVDPEIHRDLLQTDVAMLTTVGADGYPQTTALWFLFDDGLIKLSLNSSRQKTRNLRSNPHVNFFVLDRAKAGARAPSQNLGLSIAPAPRSAGRRQKRSAGAGA